MCLGLGLNLCPRLRLCCRPCFRQGDRARASILSLDLALLQCAEHLRVHATSLCQLEVGRALGEVTRYLVYNARECSGDNSTDSCRRTEDIGGVKDMRFQVLMPDVLHWLGVKKIDNMISMSDMKHDAIVNSGIPIARRYEIPEDLIPPDSRVEIDAKIAAGYFSTTQVTELSKTAGRLWEDLSHSTVFAHAG
ncbi:hypothetical protein JCM10207_008838 [Rhodosporidiobolus poonsookiae]